MKRLDGRVAVVTGAASGIGRGLAERFARERMKVVLADIEGGALEAVAKELELGGASVLAQPTDVSQLAQVEALAQAALARFGAVHVVCNNAGVVTAGPAHELSQHDWEWVMNVNLWGPIYGVRVFVPILLEQEEAHIISTASTAGLLAAPHIAPYNVTKFGVVALMETLARELAGTKVGVSVLCPGPINTRIGAAERNRPSDKRAHRETEAERRFYAGVGPMLAAGMEPAQVAELVVAAIRTDRFWVLTHPADYHPLLRRRLDLLISDGALTARPRGPE